MWAGYLPCWSRPASTNPSRGPAWSSPIHRQALFCWVCKFGTWNLGTAISTKSTAIFLEGKAGKKGREEERDVGLLVGERRDVGTALGKGKRRKLGDKRVCAVFSAGVAWEHLAETEVGIRGERCLAGLGALEGFPGMMILWSLAWSWRGLVSCSSIEQHFVGARGCSQNHNQLSCNLNLNLFFSKKNSFFLFWSLDCSEGNSYHTTAVQRY